MFTAQQPPVYFALQLKTDVQLPHQEATAPSVPTPTGHLPTLKRVRVARLTVHKTLVCFAR